MAGWSDEASILIRGLASDVAGLAGRIEGLEVVVRDGWQVCTCPGLPHPPFTAIMTFDRSADPVVAASLPVLLSRFRARDVPPTVLLAGGVFPAAETAARRLGLTEAESLPGMVVRPDELLEPRQVDARIRRIDSAPGDLSCFAAVAVAGFGLSAAAADLIASPRMMATRGVAYHLAETADGPACCTITVTARGATGVYLVGTAPEQRRRGLAAALVWRAVADAFADGARIAYLQASSMGLSVYRSLGFRVITHELRLSPPRG